MSYNITWDAYPALNVTGGFEQIAEYINTTTSGYFGIGILIPLWIILYISFKRWGDMEAVAAATFITMAVSGMLRAMKLITDLPFIVLIIFMMLSMMLLFRRTQ